MPLMRLQLFISKYLQNKKSLGKILKNLALISCAVYSLTACMPYNDQNVNNSNNGSIANRPFMTQTANPPTATSNNTGSSTNAYYPDSSNSNTSNAYYPPNPNSNVTTTYYPTPSSSTTTSTALDHGVKALFDCTTELGYNVNFTASDYQTCLQMTQASLTDYAFEMLGGFLMSWADQALDKALNSLGFMNSRSLTNTQAKTSQLTSIISTSYRWY